jgi:signal transduction histidine kinase
VRPGQLPWSLGVKLGLVLFLIVSAAIAIVYAAVIPRLESRLVNATYDSLRRSLPLTDGLLAGNEVIEYPAIAESLEEQLNARVVVFGRLGSGGLIVLADSYGRPEELARDPLVVQLAETGERAQNRTERRGREYADLVVPTMRGRAEAVMLSAPLAPRLSAVGVVRRDLIVFGGVALAASWVVGALASLKLTRRIRRLEVAAEQLAAGDFGAEVSDPGHDEVAELARTFDRMRVRLAQLDNVRREFIANASHELRTPLFALGGFLELLADEELDERTRRDFLETAQAQVERLTRLATDLLDLSRLDADQLAVKSESVDLASVAETLAEEFGPLAEAAEHELRVAAAGDVVARSDRERLLQVGRCLVENALRHTPPGTTVDIRAAVWIDRAELAVHDDGPGIQPDEQERVFERFFRGTGSAAGGSGIGLAVASELAARMGGSIALRSHPGSTTFTVALPRAAAAAPFSRENALVEP